MRVNTAPSNTNEFLWAQAGSPGTLALALVRAPTRSGQPDSFPNWVDDPQGATTVKWCGYAAVITNAASLSPTIAQQRFTEKPMHYGQICNQGIGCTVSGGDRTMADYFGVQPRARRRAADRLQRHDEPAPRRAPVRGAAARGQDAARQVAQRPRPEEPDEGRRRRRAVAALLAGGAGPEPAAARLDERSR